MRTRTRIQVALALSLAIAASLVSTAGLAQEGTPIPPPPAVSQPAPPPPPPGPPAPPVRVTTESPPFAPEPVVSPAPLAPGQPAPAPPTLHLRDIFNANDDVPLRTPVGKPVFAEELAPPSDPNDPDAIRFALHSYFRAPLLMAWQERQNPTAGQGKFEFRSPYLIDNDYVNSGFVYTPVNETGYGEFFFMAGNKSLTATVALMASEYSDSSEININQQLGVSQGYLTYRYDPTLIPAVKTHFQVKAGAFWDRFGYLEHYDTYIFGRTHQAGYQLRLDADFGDWNVSVLQGGGAHVEDVQANQAFSLLNYMRAEGTYKDQAQFGLYYLRTWSDDQPPLTQWQDGSLLVVGVDARVNSPTLGRLYVATSAVHANESLFLAPSIELMHSQGGTGLTDNYFGTSSSNNGTGAMWNVGWQYDYSLASLLHTLDPHHVPLWGGDMRLSFFGLYSYVVSDQRSTDPTINRSGVKYFKYGFEYYYWALSWMGISARYDRIVPNVDDGPTAFRIIAPRLNLRTHWMGEALIYLQWSHYIYGDGVALRPGQEAGVTVPDKDVLKLQAQIEF